MTKQALNSIQLYRHGDAETIVKLLQLQNKSVVNELLFETGSKDIYELAAKLSLGTI